MLILIFYILSVYNLAAALKLFHKKTSDISHDNIETKVKIK